FVSVEKQFGRSSPYQARFPSRWCALNTQPLLSQDRVPSPSTLLHADHFLPCKMHRKYAAHLLQGYLFRNLVQTERLNLLVREQNIRSEEHTSELQSRFDLVCRLLLEK